MLVKTSELTGAALDWAVAKCEGWQPVYTNGALEPLFRKGESIRLYLAGLNFSSDWAQGGPIVEREKIDIEWEPNGKPWCMARVFVNKRTYRQIGETPLVAAMRCYVASKLGDSVEIPKELV